MGCGRLFVGGPGKVRLRPNRASRGSVAGFMAGRSIWRDAASTHDPARREAAAKDAARRLSELSAVTRKYGNPFAPRLEGNELVQAFPEFWYAKWHR